MRHLVLVTALLVAGGGSGDPEAGRSASSAPPAAVTPAPTGTAPPRAAAAPSTPAASPTGSAARAVQPSVVTTGLAVPWGLAFLPDGSALVSERESAKVWRVTPAGARSVVATVSGVVPQGEGGLLGLAVSSTYARDRWVYAYYTSATDNRVVRFTLGSDAQEVLLSGIPKAGNHNGGRLRFGPDGMLYVGTGDASEPSRAQDKGSLAGKVLRLRPTGGAAPGNPFGTPVWSLGHRNVQGLAFDSAGRLWATEFGQNAFDEVNLVERGRNYGWPDVEGPEERAGFTAPKVVWSTADASPSGVAFAGNELHVAALRGTRLWDVPLRGAAAGDPVARYRGTYGRLRAVEPEPGGRAVWVTTSNCDGRGDCPSSGDAVLRLPL